MNDKPQSPYKLTPQSLREVCFDVSQQDYNEFKFRFATHGSVDAVLGTLFYHFVQSIKSSLPLAMTPEIEQTNNTLFNQMIPNLTFPFNGHN